jgi:hypothetical protein
MPSVGSVIETGLRGGNRTPSSHDRPSGRVVIGTDSM